MNEPLNSSGASSKSSSIVAFSITFSSTRAENNLNLTRASYKQKISCAMSNAHDLAKSFTSLVVHGAGAYLRFL